MRSANQVQLERCLLPVSVRRFEGGRFQSVSSTPQQVITDPPTKQNLTCITFKPQRRARTPFLPPK